MSSEKPALAAQLDTLRRNRGYSVRELAELAGINYTYVSKILAGRHIPSLSTLEKLAHALQVNIASLLNLYEDLPHQMLTRLVAEYDSTSYGAARGNSSSITEDQITISNLPSPMMKALLDITADSQGTRGISEVLRNIASIDEPNRRQEIINAIAKLVKCYVSLQGEDE